MPYTIRGFRFVGPALLIFLASTQLNAQRSTHDALENVIGVTTLITEDEVPLTRRLLFAAAGGAAVAVPIHFLFGKDGQSVTEGGAPLALGYVIGAAAGATFAGRDRGDLRGALIGGLIGAAPLLIEFIEENDGETGVETIMIPIVTMTIPIGAGIGAGWK